MTKPGVAFESLLAALAQLFLGSLLPSGLVAYPVSLSRGADCEGYDGAAYQEGGRLPTRPGSPARGRAGHPDAGQCGRTAGPEDSRGRARYDFAGTWGGSPKRHACEARQTAGGEESAALM